MMYPDNELTPCPTCGALGVSTKNIFNQPVFGHKIPSPRLEGYFTFTFSHQQ